jgi:hypothetical protein
LSTPLFIIFPLAALTRCAFATPAPATGLGASCRMRSNYDFTVSASSIAFERPWATTQRIEMNRGG